VNAKTPRTAIVAGDSSGIGAAIARAFGALGWSVALGARRTGRLETVAHEVEESGGRAAALALDLAEPASIDAPTPASARSARPACS
jgi:NADP-dependent 3-hydroxy acid dehydrogenase YdfG